MLISYGTKIFIKNKSGDYTLLGYCNRFVIDIDIKNPLINVSIELEKDDVYNKFNINKEEYQLVLEDIVTNHDNNNYYLIFVKKQQEAQNVN